MSVFPITSAEADALHKLGWNSGYGWDTEYDWYHMPSNGPAIFVEDDPGWLAHFLSDLEGIRRTEAERLRVKRLHDAAPTMAAYIEARALDGDAEAQAILREIEG